MADFSEFLVNAEITVRSYDTEFSKLDQAKMIASDIIQELHNCWHLPEHTVLTVSWFPEEGDKECKCGSLMVADRGTDNG